MGDDDRALLEQALREALAGVSARVTTPAEREATAPALRELALALARLSGPRAPDGELAPRRELLSVVCHDLREPLSSIIMGAAFLRRALPTDESLAPARRVVDAVQRSAERMNLLIGDFYEISKLEAGQVVLERQTYGSAELARAAHDHATGVAKSRGITVGLELNAPGSVSADRARLLQVFAKLVSNAVRVSPEGGTITLEATEVGDRVVFAVRDTGRGVAEEKRITLFDREVNQRRSPKDGPGLGLAIARGLVELHHGEIGFESQPEGGSRFWFALPMEGQA